MSKSLLDEPIFKYIDAHLSVYGHIKSNDVCSAFGLGRQKVSGVFTAYRAKFPLNMTHNVHEKCYMANETFKVNLLGNTKPQDYINAVNLVFGKQSESESESFEE